MAMRLALDGVCVALDVLYIYVILVVSVVFGEAAFVDHVTPET